MMLLFRLLMLALILAGLAPAASVMIAATIAQSHGCTLHEGFANPCVIDGKDWGQTLYAMGVMGWLMLVTLPAAALALLIWLLAEIGRWLWRRRRAGAA